MFAAIHLPRFSLQALVRREPELRGRPIALVDGALLQAAKMVVLECSEAAEAQDVCPGLVTPQAMARCRELVLKPRSTTAEQEATTMLLQTAYAFTPYLENTAPGVCTLDLRGLNFGTGDQHETEIGPLSPGFSGTRSREEGESQQNFGFLKDALPLKGAWRYDLPRRYSKNVPWTPGATALLQNWSAEIILALQQLGFEANVGVAGTPHLALLAARAMHVRQARGASPFSRVAVIKESSQFLASLPISELEPSASMLNILQRWGIHTAGAFLALGKDAIAERLGSEALELFARSASDTIRPLHIMAPSDTFEEQMEFATLIETLEPLLFVLRRFVDQLATRIALTYRVIAELRLILHLESGATYERTFKVPAPTGNVETLFRMLHTHLESLHTEAPITSLRLIARPTRAEAQQFGLFESALRDPNHFHETLARLTALLGDDRVGTPVREATHRPDSFRMKMPDFHSNKEEVAMQDAKSQCLNVQANTAVTGLCLRRFRPPIPAEVQLDEGRPVFINTLRVSGPVKQARGPWCTSGTWWDDRRWLRQEWDVELRDGSMYRLFQGHGGWLLEGAYD